jgi:[CysO sulfur-carrier protein]-S-L-cysteine hydrolase
MITIKKEVLNQIITHALNDLPNEACGYLAGKDGVITGGYALTNIDHSSEHFSFDPAEQFQTMRDVRNNQLQILANYHSHPSTPARPSEEDIRLAYDPGIHYFIISLAETGPVVKAFHHQNGALEPDVLVVKND